MASFWKKINKTFLTLLLIVGVFFAGCFGITTVNSASATFNDTQNSSNIKYDNTTMWVAYGANDVLIGVDDEGYIYKSTDGTANLTKTGVKTGAVRPSILGLNEVVSSAPGDMIAYKNYTFVVSGYDGTNTIMYYSTDNGETWLTNNLGAIGQPAAMTVGNGYFVCLLTNSVNPGIIIASTDGINWSTVHNTESGYFLDSNIVYHDGYFMYTEGTSPNKNGKNLYINISNDLTTWTRVLAPVQYTLTMVNENIGGYNYHAAVPFYLNNALYCTADNVVYKAADIASNTTWQEVGTFNEVPYKITNYGTGIVAGCQNSATFYDISNAGIENTKSLIFRPISFTGYEQESYGATICTYTDNYLCVGFSGAWHFYTNQSLLDMAYLTTYDRLQSYNVNFVDWNGNVINTQEVTEGGTVTAPTSPSREGYIFKGWDKDITEPITEDTTITAVYEIKTYTVTFVDWNSQTISTVVKEHGSTLNGSDIPTPIRDSYSFTGWDKDISQAITSDLTFIAQYSRELTLTINYLEPYGTAGFVNQYADMRPATKIFNYVYGDTIATEELENWYNTTIISWETDYSADGLYNYTYKLTGWDKELPTEITNNLVVNATYEELNLVTLKYYSQLRFLAYTEEDGTDYYYTFIGYMTIDKLMADGEIIDVEDFKNPNVNYNIYNANKNTFYNNLEHFEFLGWDKDITAPIAEDTIITAQYKMPTVQTRLFDADNYFIGTMEQQISFMTIEDLQALEGASQSWDKIREGFRRFFSLQWGDLGDMIADSIDLSNYLKSVKQYHSPDCQILTAFVCVNTDYPEYGGIFKNGLVDESSPVLEYYTGTANENNMSYWINPIMFATDLYTMTCVVSYSNVLHSVVKTVSTVFDFVWSLLSQYWWVIVLVVLLIIFRKPLIAALTMLFGAIKKGTQKLSAKIKSKSKNSKYKKTEKEYTAVKKESKKKER